MVKSLFFSILFLSFLSVSVDAAPQKISKGFWITCFDEQSPLSSQPALEKTLQFAEQGGFDTLFVQVYRGDKAWFDSSVADASPFVENRSRMGGDPLEQLIQRAHQRGIKIHAWVNTLTLSQNERAPVLKKFGTDILTLDQHGRSALGKKRKEGLDGFYQKEDQLFLEPGDPRVKEHLRAIILEIATKYPELDGIHFDYIRYPAAPPFIPGSRFNSVGLSYGYGPKNVERFRQAAGIDPLFVDGKPEESLAWDQWKRDQVTGLLRDLAAEAKKRNPRLQISCAVIAALDRGYGSAGQDWGLWLEQGIADFVVLMNYSIDPRWVPLACRSAIGVAGDPQKIAVGLGAYLLKEKPDLLQQQIEECAALNPRMIVLFDYAALSERD